MTKDEVESAWAHLPGDTQVSIMGRPRAPDGDREYEPVQIVRLLNINEDSLELGHDILDCMINGQTVIALDID